MDEEDQKIGNESDEREAGNARLRLPGFVNDEDMGLGDVLKQVTSAVGIKRCGGCERRAARLNRLLIFSGRRSK